MRHATPRTGGAARLAACGLLAAGILVGPSPTAARILKTRQPVQSGEGLALTLGSGLEYETDGEETEYGFPFLVEYGLTQNLKLSVEPGYVLLRRKHGGTTSGAGDLETTLTWELPTERRHRPGLALESVVKWPTARRGDLGTGRADYSFGTIVSKEFVQFDLDLNAVYTFVGDPPGVDLQNTLELSLASEWHLTPGLDLEAEAVSGLGTGGRFHGHPGTLGGFASIGGPEQGQSESEGTLGLAEHLSEFLKLEQGAVVKSDGTWQLVAAWEWDFGGGR